MRQLFHEPETEAAARLSGCKNIVEAVPAGNAVTLPQWGLTLDCGKAVPADVRWAGIRAHHVTAAPEGTEGAFLCAVERVIQDVFTTIVLLRPEHAAPDAPPLRMELEREDWYALEPAGPALDRRPAAGHFAAEVRKAALASRQSVSNCPRHPGNREPCL